MQLKKKLFQCYYFISLINANSRQETVKQQLIHIHKLKIKFLIDKRNFWLKLFLKVWMTFNYSDATFPLRFLKRTVCGRQTVFPERIYFLSDVFLFWHPLLSQPNCFPPEWRSFIGYKRPLFSQTEVSFSLFRFAAN